ncbi:hypothetical protein Dip518_000412 [Parelusimicrobium proximum]|uniref:hypothetical protein n=1 Tax=Parelusimicrobium proximum TaxID=3228953 RepID=UPI003D180445
MKIKIAAACAALLIGTSLFAQGAGVIIFKGGKYLIKPAAKGIIKSSALFAASAEKSAILRSLDRGETVIIEKGIAQTENGAVLANISKGNYDAIKKLAEKENAALMADRNSALNQMYGENPEYRPSPVLKGRLTKLKRSVTEEDVRDMSENALYRMFTSDSFAEAVAIYEEVQKEYVSGKDTSRLDKIWQTYEDIAENYLNFKYYHNNILLRGKLSDKDMRIFLDSIKKTSSLTAALTMKNVEEGKLKVDLFYLWAQEDMPLFENTLKTLDLKKFFEYSQIVAQAFECSKIRPIIGIPVKVSPTFMDFPVKNSAKNGREIVSSYDKAVWLRDKGKMFLKANTDNLNAVEKYLLMPDDEYRKLYENK